MKFKFFIGEKVKVVSMILAAGEAKRFGYPKQILKWKNSTILGTVITEAVEAGFDNVFVVLGAHFELISKELKNDLEKVAVVNNLNWSEGMFSSIKAGLTEIKKIFPDYVLVQLGDMPFITRNILQSFIKTAEKRYDTVIAVENNRPAHPYMFAGKFINEIINADYGDGMRSFIKREFEKAYKINVNFKAARQDIDTLDVYKKEVEESYK